MCPSFGRLKLLFMGRLRAIFLAKLWETATAAFLQPSEEMAVVTNVPRPVAPCWSPVSPV